MNAALVFRAAARREYDEAADWYESQRAGLGDRFTSAVQFVLDRIVANPSLHGVVIRDIRKAVISGFPYCVYYRIRQGTVIVISVFHTSRNPAIWRERS